MTLFPAIADNLALDFINTRFVRNNKVVNLLNHHQDLSDWLVINSEKYRPYADEFERLRAFYQKEKSIDQLVAFRDHVYHLLMAYIQATLDLSEIVSWIEKMASDHPLSLQYQQDQFVLLPKITGHFSLPMVIVLELSKLINGGEMKDLSKCYNEACVLLFINKTHKRKWCSMDICGNRKKVSKFAKK